MLNFRLKEANRVKTVLSANLQVQASVEGLFLDLDFKHIMKRTDLESLCKELIERSSGPIDSVLKSASISWVLIFNIRKILMH
jgi:molecular chaperone DnaK (HSP70)